MKRRLYSKSTVLVLNGSPGKLVLFAFAVLFCFSNGLFAGTKPSPVIGKPNTARSVTITSPTIGTGTVTGSITACIGAASISPHIQQVEVFGNGLTANITVTAPTNFQVSLAWGSGYSSNVTISQSGGLADAVVYVRSAAWAPAGNIVISTAGTASQSIPVTGVVSTLPAITPVSNQIVNGSADTTAIHDTSLSNLILKGENGTINGTLSPPFTSGTTSYTDTVTNISAVAVIPTATNPKATISVNGKTVASGTSSGRIPLVVGLNTITIMVTAPDSTTTQTYSLAVILTPYIKTGLATGLISACAGTASLSPNIEQFTVFGMVSGNIIAKPPPGFEVSLTATTGYGSSVTITPSRGVIKDVLVYVRSASSAPVGTITGNVTLTTPGGVSQNVAVTGIINALPTLNPVPNQTVINGANTATVNFTGSGVFNWVNNMPGIGLAASGTGNIPAFKAINTNTNPITATITVSPVFVLAYIALSSDSVAVINTATNTIVSRIPIVTGLAGISASPVGGKVYVLGSKGISVINTSNNTVTAIIPFTGLNPHSIIVSPDGTRIYVVNDSSVSITLPGSVLVIDASTNTVIATIPVGVNPTGASVSPDGKRIYVTNGGSVFVAGSGTVSVINAATNAVVTTIPVGSYPDYISASPDGKKMYVTNSGSNNVSVISTSTNTVVAAIPVGLMPAAIALSPDGSRAYVVNNGPNSLSVINTITNSVIATIPVGSYPISISISPDDTFIYVVNVVSKSISVINTSTNTVINTINFQNIPVSFGNFITEGGCSGTPVIFTITVNPTNSANANLTSLKLSNGTLNPNFARDTTNYTATVPNAVSSITVTPTAADSSAMIAVNDSPVASGSPSASIPLSVGPNIITTVVTAGSISKTYTVIVTRKGSDYAFLADLEISKGNLKPAFSKGIFAYRARESRKTFEITVTPTAGNAFACIKVNGIPVVSGTASPPIALNNGINNITIAVTAQNGINTKTYTLAVTKEPAPKNNLYQAAGFETGSADSLADGIKVHQGISPNGDGINDVLVIDGITNYPENNLLIINSSGVLVFETQGYDNSTRVFDGHSNKNGAMQLPGTYFYSLEYTVGNEKRHSSGFFILKY